MNQIKKNSKVKIFFSYILVTLGAIMAAFSLEAFLVPNLILDGGITGISIIISQLTKLPLGFFVIILNIPFVYIGYKNLGKRFLTKAAYSMIVFSLLLQVFHTLPTMTDDVLLATVFGGFLLGIGVGLVIRYGGCLDGTESIAIVISKKTSLSVGQFVMICNLIIFSIAGIIFSMDRAMYSLLTYFITFKVIDFVSEGFEQAKAIMIITEHGQSLANQIYKTLGRTVTFLEGNGLLSGEKTVLYCVITRLEVQELRKIVDEEDRSAFITVTDVSEIIGKHIKSTKAIKGK